MEKLNLISVRKILILAVIASSIVLVLTKQFTISENRIKKRDAEMHRIADKSDNDKLCEQYALKALKDGWFPCLKCNGITKIFLNHGEVWKYGKTCNAEFGRYPAGLPYPGLYYFTEYFGTEKECLLEEKRKIYNYPNLPECQKRNVSLLRPPGNKIDR